MTITFRNSHLTLFSISNYGLQLKDTKAPSGSILGIRNGVVLRYGSVNEHLPFCLDESGAIVFEWEG